MSIIQYSDGTKIQFSGTPTQQQAQEAYNRVKGIRSPATVTPTQAPIVQTPIKTPSIIPQMTTTNGDTYDQNKYGILPKIADFLGFSNLGKATGRLVANATGQTDKSFQGLFDALKTSDDHAIAMLHAPNASPEQITQATNILQSNISQRNQAINDYQDALTGGVTNKQVVGSAINLAGAATLGGTLGSATKAVPTLTRAIGTGAAYGTAGGVGNALNNNKSTQDTITSGISGGALGAGLGAASFGISKLIQKAGDKIINSVIKPSQADIKDGFSINTVKKYNLGGSLKQTYDKTEAKMNQLTQQLNDKLKTNPGNIDLNKVYEDTVASLSGNKLKTFGSNTSFGNALEQLQSEINQIGGKTTIPEAQLVKQASGRMGAWQYGTTDPLATAREKVYNAFYSNLKTAIEKASPEGVKEINKQLSELIPISNAVIRRIPIAERNNTLGLGELMGLAAGLVNPHALAATGLSLAQKSGQVGNALSKVGSKLIKKTPTASKAVGFIAGKLSGMQ